MQPADTRKTAPEGPLAAQILAHGCTARDADAFLSRVLPTLMTTVNAEFVALAAGRDGDWVVVSQSGSQHPLPLDLLSSALDGEDLVRRERWLAVPLDPRRVENEVLVLRFGADSLAGSLDEALDALRRGLAEVRRRDQNRSRLARLEAMLDIADRFNQVHETEPLLIEIAGAAARLLRADRASIFLWDRPNRSLVARPALGVESGELRVPDNAGVVGEVIQTGEPLRVGPRHRSDLIDHRVDKQLGYQTRNLLCVPLRSPHGQVLGAFEAINKVEGEFTLDDQAALVELAAHAAVALQNTREREALLNSRRQISEQAASRVQLIGESPAISALRSTLRRVAETELAVLILGENGTGKEVASQLIHYGGPRRDQPFISVNCAAIPDTLLESELFGHERGAFTDAHEARQGKFELASGGTLFLDEIGDLSPSGQAKLLRVVEEKVVVRVGGSRPIHTDARIIAATNQDLAAMVRARKFREDLFFRLCVVTLELPPLRERGDDVLMLAEFFLDEFCRQARRPAPRLVASARQALVAHAWPGNVRELRNLMERLAYLSSGETVEAADLQFLTRRGDDPLASLGPDTALAEATDRFQAEYIRRSIDRAGGNMADAARNLGLHRSNLYRKMRQLGMPTSR